MIFLTGAGAPLSKSGGVSPQIDPMQSLGGYISSTPAPNGSMNALFDEISSQSLNTRQLETVAIALVNDGTNAVTNLSVKTVVDKNAQASFKIAVVSVNGEVMEAISNRYSIPINGTFEDVEFNRASVDVEIVNPAMTGETVVFYPFNVVVEISETGIEGNWTSIKDAFSSSEDYNVKRISEKIFRIELRSNDLVDTPQECSFITDGNAIFTFAGKFENLKAKSGFLLDTFNSGDTLGIWIQRTPKRNVLRTNKQIIEDFHNKKVVRTKEKVELVFDYQEM